MFYVFKLGLLLKFRFSSVMFWIYLIVFLLVVRSLLNKISQLDFNSVDSAFMVKF